jgi:hypothetical protein
MNENRVQKRKLKKLEKEKPDDEDDDQDEQIIKRENFKQNDVVKKQIFEKNRQESTAADEEIN